MDEQAQEEDPLLGQLVSDRYRILRKVGEGGMGTVYEALHVAIEKRVALKVLREEYTSSVTVVERFKQEAVSASRIKHQNVIDVFDFGQLDTGACFIAMEYLEGLDLGDALKDGLPLSPERAVWVALSICRALSLAHARGVVHRDLKPENVFLQVTPEGEECVKIVDFGIAQLRRPDEAVKAEKRRRRLTKTGMIFGTPEYMAPEQARGHAVDERSDIYATGVILFEMLTGAVPFVGDSFLEVLNAHNTLSVPPLHTVNPDVSVSDELWRVVMHALEKEPDDRFPSMIEFSKALSACPEARATQPEAPLSAPLARAPSEDPMRLENSSYPSPNPGANTAMFGSPGSITRMEMEAAPERTTKGPILWVLGATMVLLGAAAAFLLLRPNTFRSLPLDRGSAVAGTSVDHRPPEPEENPDVPAPTLELSEDGERDENKDVPVEPEKRAVLHVITDPPGGTVFLDGFQVCDRAPCDVEVAAGQPVVLSGETGTTKGESKVLAQRSQNVVIRLNPPVVRAPRPATLPRALPKAAPKKQPGSALCEVMVDGIKILRPCSE